MSDNDVAIALSNAAESFRKQRILSDPFPETSAHYELLLEVAFIEGARWELGRQSDKLDARLAELKLELTNAH